MYSSTTAATASSTTISDATVSTGRRPLPLPARLDVHEVAPLETAIGERVAHGRSTIVDGSAVEMIDLSGLAALRRWTSTIDLLVVDASVALVATAEYTGFADVAARCTPRALDEAA